MKVYQAFILLILISYIYCAKSYCASGKYEISPTKAEDCTKANNDGGYCCFQKGKDNSDKYCIPVGPNAYKYISDQVKLNKKCYQGSNDDDCDKYDDFSIECNSSYLILSSLIIILLFL